MTDLDIQIDVPDDDGDPSSVRVLHGRRWLPPWLKALAIVVLGALLALVAGAYILGRASGSDDDSASTSTAPISSAADSPAVNASLEAVQGWETFARSGDVAAIQPYFDEAGPQYALFASRAAGAADGTLDFSARNVSESRSGDLTTVSMDLVVMTATGQETYPYDFVFVGDNTRVWTVVDRRTPGSVALPPPQPVIDAAAQSWGLFTSALAVDDAGAAASAVSEPTRQLASQVAAALGDDPPSPAPTAPLADPVLFQSLVDRARGASSQNPDRVLLALLDANQRRALVTGQLTAWTQVAPDRIVASLVVDGKPTAIVPFRSSEQGWAFDLVGALEAGKGGAQ